MRDHDTTVTCHVTQATLACAPSGATPAYDWTAIAVTAEMQELANAIFDNSAARRKLVRTGGAK